MPDTESSPGGWKILESSEKRISPFILFGLRNIVLLILTFNAWVHFREHLNLVFICIVFAVSVLAAIFMHLVRLRLVFSFIFFFLVVIAWRAFSFLVFRISLNPAGAVSDADFLFFYFDKDFLPALLPAFIAWLFNLLALRYRKFIFVEVGLNSLLLLAVFVTEVNYNITLYHPTVFGIILAVFILLEVLVLVLDWYITHKPGAKRRFSPAYLLLVVPLLLIFLLYSLLMEKYNRESIKNRGGLMESTLFRFDFSRYIKLESEIKLSDDLVMLMRKNGPARRILIRRFVLSGYAPDRGFYQSKGRDFDEIPVIVPDNTLKLSDPSFEERDTVEQEYFFINLDPTSLVAMNYPVLIVPLKKWDASSFLRIYRVTSQVSRLEPETIYMDDTPRMNKEHLRFYTEYAEDEVIHNLALEITDKLTSYSDKVLAIRDYLRENYFYSLKPGLAPDGNQLDYFLFDSKKGYCSYFAFAMALLCRSIGIPARVAVGFASLPEWEVLNFYEIRANLAHAWVEVYFGKYGWIEFDPTSSNIAEGEDLSFLMGFNVSDELKKLITEILNNQDKLEEESGTGEPDAKQAGDVLKELLRNFNSFIARTWFFILPALYCLFMVFLKLGNYLSFMLDTDPRIRAKHLFKHGQVRLYSLGWVKRQDESLAEYAARLEKNRNIRFVHFTGSYLKAVFAGAFTESDLEEHCALYAEFGA